MVVCIVLLVKFNMVKHGCARKTFFTDHVTMSEVILQNVLLFSLNISYVVGSKSEANLTKHKM